MFVPNHVILSHSLTRIITLFDLTLLHWFEMFRTLPVSLSLCYFQQVPRMEPKGQPDAIMNSEGNIHTLVLKLHSEGNTDTLCPLFHASLSSIAKVKSKCIGLWLTIRRHPPPHP